MEKEIKITDAELKIMECVWKRERVDSKEIIQAFEKTEDWSPNTIRTLLVRLEQKGVVTHSKSGRLYVYQALFPREYFVKQESQKFISKFFDGKVSDFISNFVTDESIDEKEIDELRELLNKRRK
ncbi:MULTISPECIES: BlaI/MecI/CopY family transcriptional regulator [Enterococcus]|uniref:BlaI/MecI/CopY family transcriptional regulator n=1 Tax=Enterococcus TaxID=1350 RepID=UPI003562BCBB